jgi:hypothetical protein
MDADVGISAVSVIHGALGNHQRHISRSLVLLSRQMRTSNSKSESKSQCKCSAAAQKMRSQARRALHSTAQHSTARHSTLHSTLHSRSCSLCGFMRSACVIRRGGHRCFHKSIIEESKICYIRTLICARGYPCHHIFFAQLAECLL